MICAPVLRMRMRQYHMISFDSLSSFRLMRFLIDRCAETLMLENRKVEADMKHRFDIAFILVSFLIASPISALPRSKSPEHRAAIRKCNDDYNATVRRAIADYKAAVKSGNKQTGMARAESLAHARRAKS